jgi:hypothetical protein
MSAVLVEWVGPPLGAERDSVEKVLNARWRLVYRLQREAASAGIAASAPSTSPPMPAICEFSPRGWDSSSSPRSTTPLARPAPEMPFSPSASGHGQRVAPGSNSIPDRRRGSAGPQGHGLLSTERQAGAWPCPARAFSGPGRAGLLPLVSGSTAGGVRPGPTTRSRASEPGVPQT